MVHLCVWLCVFPHTSSFSKHCLVKKIKWLAFICFEEGGICMRFWLCGYVHFSDILYQLGGVQCWNISSQFNRIQSFHHKALVNLFSALHIYLGHQCESLESGGCAASSTILPGICLKMSLWLPVYCRVKLIVLCILHSIYIFPDCVPSICVFLFLVILVILNV